ncbi:MAG TPA: hypothetical protein PKC72_13120 [Chitinophagaceae bacterium]|nr:hypothetical protein [Chitinophagaceae bacterium]
MPSNNHKEKYMTNLLLGMAAVTGGIFSIVYACFEKTHVSDWYFWGAVASVLICAGLYLLMNAVVHKVKADFIRRQKSREQHKTFTADAI